MEWIREKARAAKSAEDLITLAKENGMELTEDEAEAYYAQLHPTSGEISDEELDNVAGGGCGGDYNSAGFAIYPYNHVCDHFWCEYCGKRRSPGCSYHSCTPIGGGETVERGDWCRNCFSCNAAERNNNKITCFYYGNKKK